MNFTVGQSDINRQNIKMFLSMTSFLVTKKYFDWRIEKIIGLKTPIKLVSEFSDNFEIIDLASQNLLLKIVATRLKAISWQRS